jgi:hypothetical protein
VGRESARQQGGGGGGGKGGGGGRWKKQRLRGGGAARVGGEPMERVVGMSGEKQIVAGRPTCFRQFSSLSLKITFCKWGTAWLLESV